MGVGLDVEFARRFAAFLRQTRYRWCTRRTDVFLPLDAELAIQRVTIEGIVGLQLFTDFLNDNPDLAETLGGLRSADALTLYLPVVPLPKLLLLGLSIKDGSNHDLVLASRLDDAAIVAVHIVSLLRAYGLHPEDEHDFTCLLAVLATLAYTNPHELALRARRWSRANSSSPDLAGASGPPFHGRALDMWIREEGNAFVAGLGTDLAPPHPRAAVLACPKPYQEAIAEIPAPNLVIPATFKADGLATFTTLPQLLLHAVRDMLRVTAELTGRSPLAEGQPPVELGPALHTRVSTYILRGLRLLGDAVPGVAHPPYTELIRNVDVAVAHVAMTLKLGEPFVVTLEHRSQLAPRQRKFNRRRRTVHEYPFPLGDARSVHLEVQLKDPELRIRTPRAIVETRKDDGAVTRKKERIGKFPLFEEVTRASERLFHFYSSRRLDEAESIAQVSKHVFLAMPIRLTFSVAIGFVLASSATLASAAFIAYVAWWKGVHLGVAADLLPQAITLGAISVTVSLWLVQNQYSAAIVARKVRFARRALYVGVFIIIISFSALMVQGVFDGLKRDRPHAGSASIHCCARGSSVRAA